MNFVSVQRWGLAVAFCTVGWAQGRGDRPAVAPRGEGEIRPHSWIRGSGPRGVEKPQTSAGPAGVFYPSDITTAYGVTPGMGGAPESPSRSSTLSIRRMPKRTWGRSARNSDCRPAPRPTAVSGK
jgi:hypothetical protein